ncbi:hypothetical protein ACOQFV_23010 [Nocardiopsis changdeensis]|uniref:Lipoprotein n=1 Tax=Nocardiopsis changdeensis TaxID=2831969 RepID=A0ABX8BIA4_9ACTN|nr:MULTISPECIES: hypothetical protein [Nocardiopsis]QUX21946.1 hypothetical protein KGD84_26855 [Nocardiopsis changdeensis]QYX37882.1 hypothetical protein K1J57_04250 [Nocardiopsis sp. MT53]
MTNRAKTAFGALALLALAATACAPTPEAASVRAVEEDGLPLPGADGQAPSEDMSLEEAAPFLEAQGYLPAEGDLNGYEIGHLPDDVTGTPYDLDHTALAERDGHVVPDTHEVERSWLADTIQVDHLVDDFGEVMAEREAVAVSSLYVSVMRRDDFTDIDAYYEATGTVLEEEFHDSPARELPDGDGHYNGSTAIFSPEPGVVVHLSYVDDAYWAEVEESDDLTAEGDPEEVLRIVEGITPA